MKKVTFLMKPHWIREATGRIKEAGALHVSHSKTPRGENIETIQNNMESVEKAIALLREFKISHLNNDVEEGDTMAIVRNIAGLDEKKHFLTVEIETLEKEYDEIKVWGDFDPQSLDVLEKAGIKVTLFSCREGDIDRLPHNICRELVNCVDNRCYVAVFSINEEINIPFKKIEFPQRTFRDVESLLVEKRKNLIAVLHQLELYAGKVPLLKKYLETLTEKLEFEKACCGMGWEEGIAYIKGFVPAYRASEMKKLASDQGWGIVIEEPGKEDEVPTLIKHSKFSALFEPVMRFIGITPGYFEYDTNAIFTVFFAIFFAIIVGDAGYALLLLLSAFTIGRFKPFIPPYGLRLLYLLSMTTLIWGAVTGNWFGIAAAGEVPFLKSMIIPGLDSIDAAGSSTVMELCFFIALIHLSAAHVWKGVLSYPSLRAWAEGGWIILLFGIYMLVKGLILKSGSPHIALFAILSGFFLIIFFGKQGSGPFLNGVFEGLKSLPVTALDGVGGLSNMVSYLRLFAVGMASKEVAAAFNSMAFEVASQGIFSIFIAFFILIFGHGVNMLLIAMSVIVHGIRLNILEFSGHMNIEWSGIPYKPFGNSGKTIKEKSLSGHIGGGR